MKKKSRHPSLRVVLARREKIAEALALGYSLADAIEYGDQAARIAARNEEGSE